MRRGWETPSPKKLAVLFSLVVFAALVLSFGFRTTPLDHLRSTPPPDASHQQPPSLALSVPSGYIATCGNDTHAAARKRWLEADARYAHLMQDKFTIAMPTYKRPEVLNITLTKLLRDKMPSLHEIVIIWNELDKTPPEGFVSEHGVKVRYRVSEWNSLNMRLLPDPEYRTQAILQHDDDVWYEPDDLEFVFQTWQQLGRYRITGALPRCYSRTGQGLLQYHQCREGQDWYSLVLTNLAFVHISFLDYYSSDDRIPTLMREHVQEVNNCEDLAANFVASMLTCTGPLHVMGKEHYTNQDPKGGISTTPTHMSRRHNCLNYFEQLVGYLPLVHQFGSIQRGVPRFA